MQERQIDTMPPRRTTPADTSITELLQTPLDGRLWSGWTLEALFDRMENSK